jgi:hypothetical protein
MPKHSGRRLLASLDAPEFHSEMVRPVPDDHTFVNQPRPARWTAWAGATETVCPVRGSVACTQSPIQPCPPNYSPAALSVQHPPDRSPRSEGFAQEPCHPSGMGIEGVSRGRHVILNVAKDLSRTQILRRYFPRRAFFRSQILCFARTD